MPRPFNRFLDCVAGVLDRCSACGGVCEIKESKKGISVECLLCDQFAGYYKSDGIAMAEWNKLNREGSS